MTYRLYFWFKGTDPDRKGGPWWIQDFNDTLDHSAKHNMAVFKETMIPFLHAWALEAGENLESLESYPYDNWPRREVAPPQNIQINWVK